MTHVLDVTDVTVRFGTHVAVDEVSLHVDAGESVGLVGSNGAGKTTLFRAICGELALSGGEIRFEGSRLGARPDVRARSGIGRTFQLVELFGGLTVIDHLLVALQANDGRQGPVRDLLRGGDTTARERSRCMEVLEQCGLAQHADEPAMTLPLGLRRAVELARALISRPRLLLADEPSSGLDTEETRRLIDVIATAREESQLAVLIVDHDVATIEAVSDRVVAMDAGRVIAEGAYGHVMSDPAVISSWLGQSA